MFAIFLYDVDVLLSLLIHAFKRRYCISFWNARSKSKGGQFRRLQQALVINRLLHVYQRQLGKHVPESIRRTSSRAVCPQATPVDNADDCPPTPKNAHLCSKHRCKVSLTYLQTVFNVNWIASVRR